MPAARPPAPMPPNANGRRKALLGAIAFVVCLVATWALARRAPEPGREDGLPRVAARGPAPAPTFIPSARPRSAETDAPSLEDLTEDAIAALAAERAAREDALRAAVFGLAGDPTATLETRLDRYREAIEAALEAAGLEHLIAYRSALIEAFLRNESVQAELAALPPGDRQSQIDRIRAEFGYEEADLERMRQIDARKDARWEHGIAYMQARARLEATYEGSLLADELRHLREEYFGFEAPTFEAEEAEGFFRFARPRVYGRN